MSIRLQPNSRAGKISLYAALAGSVVGLASFLLFFDVNVPLAVADDVQTSVTVLNTPPTWDSGFEGRESAASATTTPTNSGATITWVGTATDSSNDDYYMIICKTSATPTPNASAAPTCDGGISNQWAVSAATNSGEEASASTTTIETFPFNVESNDWWAFVCDGNAGLPRCYSTASQGNGDPGTASPFVINHPPVFTLIANDGPVDPGDDMTWSATAYDTDTLDTTDTVRLFVCRANDFTGTDCGAGGTWATSTLVTSDPQASTTIAIPTQDRSYDAYVFVIDNHNHAATSTNQAVNSSYTVSNVAPSIDSASILLNGGNDIVLNTPSATSGPYTATFTVVDNNSCLNASAGNEISSAIMNVYRSSATCAVAGDYDANQCYINASPMFSSHVSCSQDGGSCSGSGDSDATWTCTFSLWYIADPTDVGSLYAADTWDVAIQATDDNSSNTGLVVGDEGEDVTQFMSFDVPQSGIAFGELEPGQFNDPLAATTTLIATGNVGLDEDLYGSTMCTNWAALGGVANPDACDTNGITSTNDIVVGNQRFATSSQPFADPESYTLTGSTSPAELLIAVPKTTATTSPEERETWWGINIPGTITEAGDYTGENTIEAKVSDPSFW